MRVSDGAPTAPDALLVLPASDRDIAGATLQVGDRMEIAQTILQDGRGRAKRSAISYAYLIIYNN